MRKFPEGASRGNQPGRNLGFSPLDPCQMSDLQTERRVLVLSYEVGEKSRKWQSELKQRPRGEGSSLPCPDLSLSSSGGPTGHPCARPRGWGGRHEWGRAAERRLRRSSDPRGLFSGEGGASERGRGLRRGGAGSGPSLLCDPTGSFPRPRSELIFFFFPFSSVFHSTHLLSPAQSSPGPKGAGAGRLGAGGLGRWEGASTQP